MVKHMHKTKHTSERVRFIQEKKCSHRSLITNVRINTRGELQSKKKYSHDETRTYTIEHAKPEIYNTKLINELNGMV